MAGAAIAVSAGGMAISLALLIFSGPLATELPRAIGGFLVAAAIVAGLVAYRGGHVPTVAVLQDGPAVVMVPVAAAIGATEGLGAPGVIVALGIMSLLSGIIMLAMSRLPISGIVRYLPTSVVVAFVAGTGWYLAKGGLDIIVVDGLGWRNVDDLLRWDLTRQWLPGLALGVAIVAFGRRPAIPPIAASLAVVSTVVAFHVVVASVASIESVEEDGWLIGPFPADTSVSSISLDELQTLDWWALLGHAPGLLAVIAVGVIAMLLNYSGLEVLTGERPAHHRELETTGIATLVAAPFGAVVGFLGLGDSVLARQMGVRHRATIVAAAAVVGAFAFLGTSAVALVPRFVMSGLLFAIGFELLLNWTAEVRRSSARVDQVASVAIVASMALIGILEGIVVGLVITCVLFTVRYAKIDHVRRASAGLHRGRVERPADQAEFVEAHATRIEVFELQGYLFFGSVVAVTDRVLERCASDRPIDAVIIDFRSVSGIDANGLVALESMTSTIVEAGAMVLYAGLDASTAAAIEAGGGTEAVPRHRTLDGALEAVEEWQLAHLGPTTPTPPPYKLLSDDLAVWFEPEHVRADVAVIHRGEPSDCLYVVDSGSLSAFVDESDGSRRRLRRFGRATLVGEIGFFGGTPRTASVIALTDATLLRLDRDRYLLMRRQDPAAAFELHELVLEGQASRMRSLSDELARALGS